MKSFKTLQAILVVLVVGFSITAVLGAREVIEDLNNEIAALVYDRGQLSLQLLKERAEVERLRGGRGETSEHDIAPPPPPKPASSTTESSTNQLSLWLSTAGSAGTLAGLLITNWIAIRKERREAARAGEDLQKVLFENQKLRADIATKNAVPAQRRVKRPNI
jgi:hypothetical protein